MAEIEPPHFPHDPTDRKGPDPDGIMLMFLASLVAYLVVWVAAGGGACA